MFRDRELRLLTLARLASAAGGEATFFVGVGAATLGWVNSVFGLGMAVGAAALSRAPQRFTTLARITALAAAAGVGTPARGRSDRQVWRARVGRDASMCRV